MLFVVDERPSERLVCVGPKLQPDAPGAFGLWSLNHRLRGDGFGKRRGFALRWYVDVL